MNCLSSVAYDGSRFHGFAKQPGLVTVQGHLVDVLNAFLKSPIKLFCHSRTDKGVHAMDQKIQLTLNTKIPVPRLAQILNPKLQGVCINWIKKIDDSFSITENKILKVYQYRILWSEPFPFNQHYAWFPGGSQPDIGLFKAAMELYQGRHNFKLLCKRDRSRNIQDFYREINSCHVEVNGFEWLVRIEGHGFLWGMVRHMVAYAIACAMGKLPLKTLALLLRNPEKCQKPSTKPAPASGLYLLSSIILAPDALTS